jgi:hypothetical protein
MGTIVMTPTMIQDRGSRVLLAEPSGTVQQLLGQWHGASSATGTGTGTGIRGPWDTVPGRGLWQAQGGPHNGCHGQVRAAQDAEGLGAAPGALQVVLVHQKGWEELCPGASVGELQEVAARSASKWGALSSDAAVAAQGVQLGDVGPMRHLGLYDDYCFKRGQWAVSMLVVCSVCVWGGGGREPEREKERERERRRSVPVTGIICHSQPECGPQESLAVPQWTVHSPSG